MADAVSAVERLRPGFRMMGTNDDSKASGTMSGVKDTLSSMFSWTTKASKFTRDAADATATAQGPGNANSSALATATTTAPTPAALPTEDLQPVPETPAQLALPLPPPPAPTSVPIPSPPGDGTGADTPSRVTPELPIHSFEVQDGSMGQAAVGQVLDLNGSCYVWTGLDTGVPGGAAQGPLGMALGTRFAEGITATSLLPATGGGAGDGGEELGLGMARRLSKRTGRVVFCSCNLPEESRELVAAVERHVVAILASAPANSQG
ncbi:unnamed protein product [Discosporangium mesarthrocarpum]